MGRLLQEGTAASSNDSDEFNHSASCGRGRQ